MEERVACVQPGDAPHHGQAQTMPVDMPGGACAFIGLENLSCRFGRKARSLVADGNQQVTGRDRKSTRLNSSHLVISYAVFCLKKKKLQVYIYLMSVLS